LGDFGFSSFTQGYEEQGSISNLEQDICGTPSYMAPEILRKVGYHYKCDLFSIGSLLYNLLTGSYLFEGDDNQQLL
jgi:serine/threonine protein kinase